MLIRYYEADKDTGDAGGDSDQSGKVKASDILNRYGKNEEAALRLAELYAEAQNEMWKVRERNRTLKQERDDLKGKLPADGMVVLSKDDATELEAYRALGKKPADVKTALEQAGTATADLTALRREKQIRQAADLVKFDADVLAELAGTLDIQIKGTDDKPLPVVVADGNDTALEDYAKTKWAKFMPALQAKPVNVLAPDINAGARGNGDAPLITDEERQAARRRYATTF